VVNKITKCEICGRFFDSKKQLKEHKDKNHRITDSKIDAGVKRMMYHENYNTDN
jgi:hypothetical protein